MAVSEASETPVSRKRMRFTVPPAHTYSGSWGYGSEEDIQEQSESDGSNGESQDDEQGQEEIHSDQDTSESDVDDEGLDEEEEQVEQGSQVDHKSSESEDEDEEQDEEDEQVEQERQIDQESSESDGEDEEQNEVDEQVEQERQIDQELSESDGENEEQNIEEELAEGESQNNQASIDAAGGDEEEENDEEDDVSDGGHVQKSSSEPALAPPPSRRTAIANMTLDEDMLDCGVCSLPLKPPIFQCDVGHVVCSSCRNKLATVGRCHVCLTYITGGYRRCHALEQLVKSIRVSCPNTIYGCATRAPYYDQQAHLRACSHAPCHCPAEACGFLGSTAALLHHFVDTHKWPCITGVQNSEVRVTHLHDGFNVIAVDHDAREYLFLLRVERSPFGRAISSFCIHPQATSNNSSPSPSKNVSCRLKLFYIRGVLKDSAGMMSHLQDSNFEVACTDLSNGMPGLRDCFQFIVPYGVRPETEATVKVEVSFTVR